MVSVVIVATGRSMVVYATFCSKAIATV
jgi:hypothetical protein